MDTIKKTGVQRKNKGAPLSSSDINSINDVANNCVDAINSILKAECNINQETGRLDRFFTEAEAIAAVPESRRLRGLRLRYFAAPGYFEDITYIGDSTDPDSWSDPDNWGTGSMVIDGGEW